MSVVGRVQRPVATILDMGRQEIGLGGSVNVNSHRSQMRPDLSVDMYTGSSPSYDGGRDTMMFSQKQTSLNEIKK